MYKTQMQKASKPLDIHCSQKQIANTWLDKQNNRKSVNYEDAIAPGNGEAISRFGMSNKSQTPSESSRLK